MAHVLVLTLLYPPDGVSTAVIVGELSADLKRAGHDVTVVTTMPHYNRDLEAERRQPLRRRCGGLIAASEFHGVPVWHVAMPRKTGSIIARLLAWTQFHVLSLVTALILVRRVDVILAPSPPLTVGICAWLLRLGYRAPYVYNVQELYPDIAVALGAVKNRRVIAALLALERFVYERAAAVTTIAPGMRRRIVAKGIPAAKVRLIPNFVDVDAIAPLPKDNAFSREHGLVDAFVITYAGNMGPAQELGTVLEAAARLRAMGGLTFLFVGGGSEYGALEARARAEGLNHVRFLPHQPYARVPEIYAASDLCLVPLATQAGSDAVPSKVYRIMACARPVLAIADAGADLTELVTHAGCGIVAPPGAPAALAEAIGRALATPRECAARGQAGLRYVTERYSRTAITAAY